MEPSLIRQRGNAGSTHHALRASCSRRRTGAVSPPWCLPRQEACQQALHHRAKVGGRGTSCHSRPVGGRVVSRCQHPELPIDQLRSALSLQIAEYATSPKALSRVTGRAPLRQRARPAGCRESGPCAPEPIERLPAVIQALEGVAPLGQHEGGTASQKGSKCSAVDTPIHVLDEA
jgi:hypothetical protein